MFSYLLLLGKQITDRAHWHLITQWINCSVMIQTAPGFVDWWQSRLTFESKCAENERKAARLGRRPAELKVEFIKSWKKLTTVELKQFYDWQKCNIFQILKRSFIKQKYQILSFSRVSNVKAPSLFFKDPVKLKSLVN